MYIELKQPALAATLSIQLADSLRKLEKPSEAMGHYQRAADLQYQSPLDCLHSLGQVASCKIETGDYDGALGVLTEMEYLAQERGSSGLGGRPIGAFSDVLANCQVSRVLLLMLLQVNFNFSCLTDLPHFKIKYTLWICHLSRVPSPKGQKEADHWPSCAPLVQF